MDYEYRIEEFSERGRHSSEELDRYINDAARHGYRVASVMPAPHDRYSDRVTRVILERPTRNPKHINTTEELQNRIYEFVKQNDIKDLKEIDGNLLTLFKLQVLK